MKLLYVFLVMVFGLFITVKADTWLLPTEKKYCSENKKFCLKVQPKKLESQLSYFQDKVNSKDNAGADKKAKDNVCKGIFYNKGGKNWNIQLDNEVSPVSAIVSNNGDYVVTFDNWHGTGYGDNVVAIYDASNGNLIKKLGLSDFLTESDIDNLPHSTSSIQWSGKHKFDYEKKQLILKVVKPSNDESEYFDVHIDLTNGAVLDEKVDRLPSLQFLIVTKEADNNTKTDNPTNIEITECQIGNDVKQISSSELLKRVVYKEFPKYPPAAKAVRAAGIIVINVSISENGNVECVKAISGHPLLRTSTVNAVNNWKFEKSEFKYISQIILEGKFALVLNGKTIE